MQSQPSHPNAMPVLNNQHYLSLLLLLAVWFGCFWPTLHSMLEIWQRSDTYAHGFLIFPICFFLIWQKRYQIAATPLHSSTLALLPLAALILGWFFADAVAVNVLKQLTVVLMLPMLVWLSCGWRMLKLLQFPLSYLIFAVPMGDALVAPMQNITADMTVYALRLSSIPVYREGLYISTPTGLFLVAEACSGVRYLIASFALGTLYAYLNYQGRLKQLLFCLFAIVLPVIANGIRAYGIVLVAHLSDMKHAVGVDHLIYGWLFFGLMMFLMFYLGSFWADKVTDNSVTASHSRTGKPGLNSIGSAALLLLPFSASYLLPPLTSVALYDVNSLQHSLEASTEPHSQPDFLHSSAELSGQWTGLNVPVQFYAAFYQHIDDQKLVSWHNQPYQRQYWTPAGHRRLAIQFQHHSLKVQEVDLRANDGSKRLLWFWYGSGNYFSADPYVITAMQALGKVFHISQHGSFFAVSVHYEFETDSARDTLQQLLQQKYPLIRQANLFEQNNSALTAREPQP